MRHTPELRILCAFTGLPPGAADERTTAYLQDLAYARGNG
jgi:hypothetical protein